MGNKILLLFILGSILLISCRKEDQPPSPSQHLIVGEWRALYLKEGFFTYPQMQPAFPTNFTQNYPYLDEILFDFQSDMKFKESLANKNLPSGYASATYDFALEGNKVVFSNFDKNSNFFPSGKIYIDSLTENRLVIRDSVVNTMMHTLRVRIITATR